MPRDKVNEKFLLWQIYHKRKPYDEHHTQLTQRHLAREQREGSDLTERI